MNIIYILAALLICNMLQYIFGEINNYFTTIHQDKIEKYIKMKMTRQVNNLDISYFDSPDFYNELQNVNMDSYALQSMIFYVMELLRNLISYVTTFAILLIFSWWAPVVLTVIFVPYMLVNKYYTQYVYMWNRGAIDNIRKREYLIGILGKKEAAMEERVFGFGNRFIEKYSILWDKWFLEKISLLKKETLWKAASMLIPEVTKIGITLALIINVLNHVISIGDYSMYSGLIIQLTGGVTSISYIIANLIQNKSRISLFDKFFEWKNNIPQLGDKTPSKKPFISFKNVSFKYPKTDNYVLKNISFDIKPNESVALIGTNGAGKTTIIKLILRLYDVTEGEITLDGSNIKYYDKNKLQKIYSVFFQEFFHYPLTLKESITISDIENESDTDRIYNSCYMSRLDKLLKHMPNGLDTEVTRIFNRENEVELSKGEKQKIALARAYFRDSDILILDEPSESIDAQAEKEIFDIIDEMCVNKTVIFISHRLANAITADKIIVIDGGTIVEQGSHSQLINFGRKYAELFNIQADRYKEGSI